MNTSIFQKYFELAAFREMLDFFVALCSNTQCTVHDKRLSQKNLSLIVDRQKIDQHQF